MDDQFFIKRTQHGITMLSLIVQRRIAVEAREWLDDRDIIVVSSFQIIGGSRIQLCVNETAFDAITEEDRAEFVLRFC